MVTATKTLMCEVCGVTAYYSYGEYRERPRCVKCHEVERSLRHYLQHSKGVAFVEKLLKEAHARSKDSDR